MTEHTYTVISTSITQEIPEDYQVPLVSQSSRTIRHLHRPKTILKMEVVVDGYVLGYEAEIPPMTMTRRLATSDEIELAAELSEVDRRHQERLERRGRWPR
jgi:hypothetical protein